MPDHVMPDRNDAGPGDAGPGDAGPGNAGPGNAPESPEELRARQRAWLRERGEVVDEMSTFCQDALMRLVSAGVTIAEATAERAQNAGLREQRDPYATTGFKGGAPAAKAYAAVSQGVRRCILLLQKVIHYGWWEDFATPGASKRADRWQRAALGLDDLPPPDDAPDRGETQDRLDRLDRLDRPETLEAVDQAEDFGRDVTPPQVAGLVKAWEEDMAAAAELSEGIALSSFPEEPDDWDEVPAGAVRRREPPD